MFFFQFKFDIAKVALEPRKIDSQVQYYLKGNSIRYNKRKQKRETLILEFRKRRYNLCYNQFNKISKNM